MQHMGITDHITVVMVIMDTGEVITTDGMVSFILFIYFQTITI
jgi:ABC-type antimicrobial peptide transport system ATPase subunit